MNERIEKLAEQAGFTVARGYGLKDTVPKDVFIANVCVSDEMKKFAELIVRECAQVCLSQRDPANLNYKPSERFAEAVKQHFGVDE
jgi:hypothetical protein